VPSMAPATMRRRTVWIGAVAVRDSAPPTAPARRCARGLLLRVPGDEPDVLAEEVRSRASNRRVPRERDTLASPSRGRAWLCDNDANAGGGPSARGRRTRGIVPVPRRPTEQCPPRSRECRGVLSADVLEDHCPETSAAAPGRFEARHLPPPAGGGILHSRNRRRNRLTHRRAANPADSHQLPSPLPAIDQIT
jgi:hypothetical protein